MVVLSCGPPLLWIRMMSKARAASIPRTTSATAMTGRSSGMRIRNSRVGARAVEPRRLEDVARDVLKAREQHEGDERRRQPDVGRCHGEERDLRIAEPADVDAQQLVQDPRSCR